MRRERHPGGASAGKLGDFALGGFPRVDEACVHLTGVNRLAALPVGQVSTADAVSHG